MMKQYEQYIKLIKKVLYAFDLRIKTITSMINETRYSKELETKIEFVNRAVEGTLTIPQLKQCKNVSVANNYSEIITKDCFITLRKIRDLAGENLSNYTNSSRILYGTFSDKCRNCLKNQRPKFTSCLEKVFQFTDDYITSAIKDIQIKIKSYVDSFTEDFMKSFDCVIGVKYFLRKRYAVIDNAYRMCVYKKIID